MVHRLQSFKKTDLAITILAVADFLFVGNVAKYSKKVAELAAEWIHVLLTGHLSHDSLRNPPVPQESFDLFFDQTAVPSANRNTATLLKSRPGYKQQERKTAIRAWGGISVWSFC